MRGGNQGELLVRTQTTQLRLQTGCTLYPVILYHPLKGSLDPQKEEFRTLYGQNIPVHPATWVKNKFTKKETKEHKKAEESPYH